MRAKRATFTFLVDKSSLKMLIIVIFQNQTGQKWVGNVKIQVETFGLVFKHSVAVIIQ